MNDKPSLSVIIPAYNSESYIGESIGSVLKQNWNGELEIIIIDDGSDDNTAKAAKDSGATVVLQKSNGGAASARNIGIRKASGEFIFFLDADDVLTENALDNLYDPFINNSDLDVTFAMAEDFISPELSDTEKALLIPRGAPYSGGLTGCSLFKKEVFKDFGLFREDLKSGETIELMMRLQHEQLNTIKVDVVTLKRRLHLNNTGRKKRDEEMKNYAAILRAGMKR